MRQTEHLLAVIVLAAVITGLAPRAAGAHADYARSEPPAGAAIPRTPLEVHVWFTEELFRRAGANALEVYGPDGAQVDRGDARIDDDDRAHMVVSLPANLAAGVYTVRWRSLSAEDGHAGEGEFTFTVDPTAMEVITEPVPTATPAPADTATPAPVTSPSPPPAATPAASTGGELLIVGGLAVVAVAMVVLLWRGRGRV